MAGMINRMHQRGNAGAEPVRGRWPVLFAEGYGWLLPSVGFTLLLPTVGGRSVQRR
jgi:hypothetical protein